MLDRDAALLLEIETACGCIESYQSIDRAAIWSIVQRHLPPLRGAVLRMLAARGEAP